METQGKRGQGLTPWASPVDIAAELQLTVTTEGRCEMFFCLPRNKFLKINLAKYCVHILNSGL